MRTVIIDCMALCYQSLFTPSVMLSNATRYTGVIYGFLRQLVTISSCLKSNHFIFCWDGPRDKSVRVRSYPQYKQRPPVSNKSPQEMAAIEAGFRQIVELRDNVIPQLGFRNNFYFEEFEADDIIAAIVQSYDYEEFDGFCVVSCDADLYQLLNDCHLYLLRKKVFYTKNNLLSDYQVTPGQWARVKCIAGCQSDNVDGIPRVGIRTACKYVSGGTVTPAIARLLSEQSSLDIIKRNKELVVLPHSLFPEICLYVFRPLDYKASLEVLQQYHFKSFITGNLSLSWKNMIEGRFE